MLTANPAVAQTSNAMASVLVVDDEYGPRESIAYMLTDEFSVDTAERAGEALAKLRRREYGAVVLDIRMPEMDGIRALEEIRKIDREVSIIILTGYGTTLTAQQAILGGANHFLRKPPDVEELIAAVRLQTKATWMRRYQAGLARDALELNITLKREIERHEPQIWRGRASVELVHDLNNPLTVVMTTLVSFLKRSGGSRKPIPRAGLSLWNSPTWLKRRRGTVVTFPKIGGYPPKRWPSWTGLT